MFGKVNILALALGVCGIYANENVVELEPCEEPSACLACTIESGEPTCVECVEPFEFYGSGGVCQVVDVQQIALRLNVVEQIENVYKHGTLVATFDNYGWHQVEFQIFSDDLINEICSENGFSSGISTAIQPSLPLEFRRRSFTPATIDNSFINIGTCTSLNNCFSGTRTLGHIMTQIVCYDKFSDICNLHTREKCNNGDSFVNDYCHWSEDGCVAKCNLFTDEERCAGETLKCELRIETDCLANQGCAMIENTCVNLTETGCRPLQYNGEACLLNSDCYYHPEGGCFFNDSTLCENRTIVDCVSEVQSCVETNGECKTDCRAIAIESNCTNLPHCQFDEGLCKNQCSSLDEANCYFTDFCDFFNGECYPSEQIDGLCSLLDETACQLEPACDEIDGCFAYNNDFPLFSERCSDLGEIECNAAYGCGYHGVACFEECSVKPLAYCNWKCQIKDGSCIDKCDEHDLLSCDDREGCVVINDVCYDKCSSFSDSFSACTSAEVDDEVAYNYCTFVHDANVSCISLDCSGREDESQCLSTDGCAFTTSDNCEEINIEYVPGYSNIDCSKYTEGSCSNVPTCQWDGADCVSEQSCESFNVTSCPSTDCEIVDRRYCSTTTMSCHLLDFLACQENDSGDCQWRNGSCQDTCRNPATENTCSTICNMLNETLCASASHCYMHRNGTCSKMCASAAECANFDCSDVARTLSTVQRTPDFASQCPLMINADYTFIRYEQVIPQRRRRGSLHPDTPNLADDYFAPHSYQDGDNEVEVYVQNCYILNNAVCENFSQCMLVMDSGEEYCSPADCTAAGDDAYLCNLFSVLLSDSCHMVNGQCDKSCGSHIMPADPLDTTLALKTDGCFSANCAFDNICYDRCSTSLNRDHCDQRDNCIWDNSTGGQCLFLCESSLLNTDAIPHGECENRDGLLKNINRITCSGLSSNDCEKTDDCIFYGDVCEVKCATVSVDDCSAEPNCFVSAGVESECKQYSECNILTKELCDQHASCEFNGDTCHHSCDSFNLDTCQVLNNTICFVKDGVECVDPYDCSKLEEGPCSESSTCELYGSTCQYPCSSFGSSDCPEPWESSICFFDEIRDECAAFSDCPKLNETNCNNAAACVYDQLADTCSYPCEAFPFDLCGSEFNDNVCTIVDDSECLALSACSTRSSTECEAQFPCVLLDEGCSLPCDLYPENICLKFNSSCFVDQSQGQCESFADCFSLEENVCNQTSSCVLHDDGTCTYPCNNFSDDVCEALDNPNCFLGPNGCAALSECSFLNQTQCAESDTCAFYEGLCQHKCSSFGINDCEAVNPGICFMSDNGCVAFSDCTDLNQTQCSSSQFCKFYEEAGTCSYPCSSLSHDACQEIESKSNVCFVADVDTCAAFTDCLRSDPITCGNGDGCELLEEGCSFPCSTYNEEFCLQFNSSCFYDAQETSCRSFADCSTLDELQCRGSELCEFYEEVGTCSYPCSTFDQDDCKVAELTSNICFVGGDTACAAYTDCLRLNRTTCGDGDGCEMLEEGCSFPCSTYNEEFCLQFNSSCFYDTQVDSCRSFTDCSTLNKTTCGDGYGCEMLEEGCSFPCSTYNEEFCLQFNSSCFYNAQDNICQSTTDCFSLNKTECDLSQTCVMNAGNCSFPCSSFTLDICEDTSGCFEGGAACKGCGDADIDDCFTHCTALGYGWNNNQESCDFLNFIVQGNGNVTIGNNVTITGDNDIEGNLELGDDAVIKNINVTANTTLSVGNNVTINNSTFNGDVSIDGNAKIDESAIDGNVTLSSGSNVTNSTISGNTTIGDDSLISNSKINGESNVGSNSSVKDSQLDGDANIGSNSTIDNSTIIGKIIIGANGILDSVTIDGESTENVTIGDLVKLCKTQLGTNVTIGNLVDICQEINPVTRRRQTLNCIREGPVDIGRGVVIGDDNRFCPDVSIGSFSTISNSNDFGHSEISSNVIIGNENLFGNDVSVEESASIDNGNTIEDSVVIKEYVVIGSNNNIPAASTVDKDVGNDEIWGVDTEPTSSSEAPSSTSSPSSSPSAQPTNPESSSFPMGIVIGAVVGGVVVLLLVVLVILLLKRRKKKAKDENGHKLKCIEEDDDIEMEQYDYALDESIPLNLWTTAHIQQWIKNQPGEIHKYAQNIGDHSVTGKQLHHLDLAQLEIFLEKIGIVAIGPRNLIATNLFKLHNKENADTYAYVPDLSQPFKDWSSLEVITWFMENNFYLSDQTQEGLSASYVNGLSILTSSPEEIMQKADLKDNDDVGVLRTGLLKLKDLHKEEIENDSDIPLYAVINKTGASTSQRLKDDGNYDEASWGSKSAFFDLGDAMTPLQKKEDTYYQIKSPEESNGYYEVKNPLKDDSGYFEVKPEIEEDSGYYEVKPPMKDDSGYYEIQPEIKEDKGYYEVQPNIVVEDTGYYEIQPEIKVENEVAQERVENIYDLQVIDMDLKESHSQERLIN